MTKTFSFKWSELAFGSKKEINQLQGIFIIAPRKLSTNRFIELIKQNLSTGNIVVGISIEDHVLGFEDQPQFEMLRQSDIQNIIDSVNAAKLPHKIYTLEYSQRDIVHIIDKLTLRKVVLVNGSWKLAFHVTPLYYSLVNKRIDFEFVSPFVDEKQAKKFATKTNKLIQNKLGIPSPSSKTYEANEILEIVDKVSKRSYVNSFHTAAAIAQEVSKGKYRLQHTAYNYVVPYETFAMHHGASREKFLSPPNDLNHYDTVHAEVSLIIDAAKARTDLSKSTLFINVLPCPVCSRILVRSQIKKILYQHDHTDGYAVKLLGDAGVKVERLVI